MTRKSRIKECRLELSSERGCYCSHLWRPVKSSRQRRRTMMSTSRRGPASPSSLFWDRWSVGAQAACPRFWSSTPISSLRNVVNADLFFLLAVGRMDPFCSWFGMIFPIGTKFCLCEVAVLHICLQMLDYATEGISINNIVFRKQNVFLLEQIHKLKLIYCARPSKNVCTRPNIEQHFLVVLLTFWQ